MVRDEDIQQRLKLGEDNKWEFKRVEFSGRHLLSPSRGDLAAEIIAFANADGGWLLMGVAGDGILQDVTREQMDVLDKLVVEVGTAAIKPNLYINVNRRKLFGKAFVLVQVPKGDSLYECGGRSWIRVGASKRRLTGDEPMRLAQRRAQGRHLSFDGKPVAKTGFNTLDPALWRLMLSAEDAIEPEVALSKLALLTSDESGFQCATVSGVLLCTRHPEQWLPNAAISATRYRGTDRTTGEVDSQEITGPLQQQIADALTFTRRNMQVAARKTPARIDMPQYSEKAIFEAVVNAVVHRDYSIRGSRIRLSMFSDRLEIQSPGALPSSLTLESMMLRQATRNEIIASVMGRMGVDDIRGSADRRYFMERRGDGVPTIIRETRELSGRAPEYRLIDDAEVLLRMPAAPQESISSRVVVTVRTDGQPLPEANVLVLFPNRTWNQAVSDENGEATLDLYTTEMPVTVFGAALGFSAGLVREWLPATGALALDLAPMPRGGSVIYAEATGHVPGLKGRLNPIRDKLGRTYLYASDLSIDRGRPQPVQFVPGETLQLTDSDGAECHLCVVEIVGRSALLEHWVPGSQE